jgi:hypothetical protein
MLPLATLHAQDLTPPSQCCFLMLGYDQHHAQTTVCTVLTSDLCPGSMCLHV